PLLHQHTILLTLQNGLGNEDFLAQHFGDDRVMGGLCFICLSRISPGLIEHLDYGHLIIGEFIGSLRARTCAVAREFQRSNVVCQMVDNLMEERWRKLVWNIPFNGLTIAAGGITTEEILREASLHSAALAWKQKQPEAEIASVPAISVLIVGDRRMAALHKEFCGFAGPTDVLTFQHGEIVISAETAARQARIFHSNLIAEIRLYLLHGLL